jgi:signal transduction histidine kinase/AmiR/NasT family two-component response regulator
MTDTPENEAVLSARVFIVEDERIIAKDIEQTLKSLGYSVCGVADSGEVAIEQVPRVQPDLILMDVRIRGDLDGIQTAERIRQSQNVPIVFLTAFADEPTLRRARSAAPYGYVLKPFEDRDLHAATMMALAKHRAFRELDERVRERTEALLSTEMRFRQLSVVAELGLFALRMHDPRLVLQRAAQVVCDTLGVEYASVLEVSSDGNSLWLRAKVGWPDRHLASGPFPTGTQSQSGYTLLSAEPVVSEDYSQESRFVVPDEVKQEGVVGGMTVVIHSQGDARPYGILAVHTKSKRTFTTNDSALMQAVANLIATTIARSRADERRLQAERRAEEDRLRAIQAQEALRQRDEFLSIASHELKTPLTSLQLHLQSLTARADALDQSVSSKLERATRSMDRVASLVEDLLDVSRISSAGLELRRQPVQLDNIVTEVTDLYREEAARAGCELRVTHIRGTVQGLWDPVRIEQVLTNLLTNACKYGSGHPVEVTVDTSGKNAEIRVKDGGPGIAPKDVERIFLRFERAAPVRHYGGLGLGLYISRQIVEAHGGSIHVDSKPGQGSTFTVRLPFQPRA